MVRKEDDTSVPLAEWIVVAMIGLVDDSFVRSIGVEGYGAAKTSVASDARTKLLSRSIAPEIDL